MSTPESGPRRGVAAAVAFAVAATALTVVLAVALSLAISTVVDAIAPGRDVSSSEAVISVLCFGVFIITLVTQQRQMIKQYTCLRDQLKFMEQSHGVLERSHLTDQHRLQNEMLYRAIERPELAAAFQTYPDEIPVELLQQRLFCNVVYNNVLHAYRIGYLDLADAEAHFRVICRSPAFREFWQASQGDRAGLPYESQEAALCRVVNRVLQQPGS